MGELVAMTDYENIGDVLTGYSSTTCKMVFDLDKANYLTMEMKMTTDGDFSGTEDMGCIKIGMLMEDPMSMPMDVNMSMALWLDDPESEGAYKGMMIADKTENGLTLRQRPSDGFDVCDTTMAMSLRMTGDGCPG